MRDGWIEANLIDAVDVLDRFRRPISSTEREGRQGTIPYYGANGQAGWIDDSIFNEELVLLGEDAIDFLDPDARKAYLISGPSWVNNHVHVLRAKPEKVYSFFLAESLNRIDYSQYVSFGTRSKLTQASMNGIKILLPPLDEQKRIVDLISSFETYIGAITKQGLKNFENISLLGKITTLRSAILADLLSGNYSIPKSYDAVMDTA
jgi:type I restriction enzyme S subunit